MSNKKQEQPVTPAIRAQVEAAFLAARSVHRKLSTLAEQTDTQQSRNFMFEITNAMEQIIAVLNTKDVELITKEIQAKRDKITKQIGTDVYARLTDVIDILDKNDDDRDEQVRKALLAIVDCFPEDDT